MIVAFESRPRMVKNQNMTIGHWILSGPIIDQQMVSISYLLIALLLVCFFHGSFVGSIVVLFITIFILLSRNFKSHFWFQSMVRNHYFFKTFGTKLMSIEHFGAKLLSFRSKFRCEILHANLLLNKILVRNHSFKLFVRNLSIEHFGAKPNQHLGTKFYVLICCSIRFWCEIINSFKLFVRNLSQLNILVWKRYFSNQH